MEKLYVKTSKYQKEFGSFDLFLAAQKQYYDGQSIKYMLTD